MGKGLRACLLFICFKSINVSPCAVSRFQITLCDLQGKAVLHKLKSHVFPHHCKITNPGEFFQLQKLPFWTAFVSAFFPCEVMALTRAVKSPCPNAIFHRLPCFSLLLAQTTATPSCLQSSVRLFLEATPTESAAVRTHFYHCASVTSRAPTEMAGQEPRWHSSLSAPSPFCCPMVKTRAEFGFVFFSGFLWQWGWFGYSLITEFSA